MYALNASAAAPTRATGSFTLSFGIISIPLSIFNGSEEVRVPRKEFVEGDVNRPAGRATTDKSTGDVIKDGELVVRMAEASNGTFVILTDDEIAECSMPKGVADIVTFVKREWMWEYLPEDVAQVRPRSTKGKSNPAEVKAFSLLLSAMADKDVSALVRYGTKAGVRYGLLTFNGDLILVKTNDQIRQRLPLDLPTCSAAEMALASQLIDAVGVAPVPIFNETAAKVREFVDSKAAGTAPASPVPSNLTAPTPDLVALLAQSLATKQAQP